MYQYNLVFSFGQKDKIKDKAYTAASHIKTWKDTYVVVDQGDYCGSDFPLELRVMYGSESPMNKLFSHDTLQPNIEYCLNWEQGKKVIKMANKKR